MGLETLLEAAKFLEYQAEVEARGKFRVQQCTLIRILYLFFLLGTCFFAYLILLLSIFVQNI